MPEVLIEAENIGKKFCRSLKRSLWYGVQDILGDLNPRTDRARNKQQLRENEFWALQDVSFQLLRGECLGLIGHNGAGKSTLLKILNGLIRPDSGQLTIRGKVGALIELSAGLNPVLTGRENIYNRGAVLGFSREEITKKFDAIVDFAEIDDFIDMPVRNYSSGMSVRLGFAVSSQMEPDILLLDEILAVGDASFRHKCLTQIYKSINRCATIFVSHSMPQIHRICTKVIHLSSGTIEYSGFEIGKGIQSYLSHLAKPEPSRTGSDAVNIIDFKLHTEDECPPSTHASLTSGDPICITIKMRVQDSETTPLFKLSLWNTELIPVSDILTEKFQPFEPPRSENGEYSFRVDLQSVELPTGTYSFALLVEDRASRQPIARFQNIASLMVNCPYPTGAATITAAKWMNAD